MNNTPRNLDDHDASEWGNVELPGLSDEKLHGTNWTKITAIKRAIEVRKKIQAADPIAYREKQSAISKEVFKDPIKKHNHALGIEKRDNNPEYQKIVKLARQNEARSPQGRERRKKQRLDLLQSENGDELRKKISESRKSKAKPLITIFGIFRSVPLLINFLIEKKLLPTIKSEMALSHKIRKLIKDDPKNNFYISLDEYELCLKDKNQIEILKSKPIRKQLEKEAKKRLIDLEKNARENLKRTKNNKPIVVEWGIYSSKKNAIIAANKLKLNGNAEYKIKKGLKELPDRYYYITKEEYTRLTGKEL